MTKSLKDITGEIVASFDEQFVDMDSGTGWLIELRASTAHDFLTAALRTAVEEAQEAALPEEKKHADDYDDAARGYNAAIAEMEQNFKSFME